ncbi:hypothetical protein CBL_09117 [Carabus blaptoides fortunei]
MNESIVNDDDDKHQNAQGQLSCTTSHANRRFMLNILHIKFNAKNLINYNKKDLKSARINRQITLEAVPSIRRQKADDKILQGTNDKRSNAPESQVRRLAEEKSSSYTHGDMVHIEPWFYKQTEQTDTLNRVNTVSHNAITYEVDSSIASSVHRDGNSDNSSSRTSCSSNNTS